MQLSLVLWDGNVGGAEKFTAELAGALRSAGVDASVLFVRDPGPLVHDLHRLGVPYTRFGARRSAEVLLRPRRFARAVATVGSAGALLPAPGHLALALRLGGYRAPIAAIEHGALLLIPAMPLWQRAMSRLERRLSWHAVDTQVAVSPFMSEQVLRTSHSDRVVTIENGIDVRRFRPPASDPGATCTFACATRMVPGKGLVELIEAFARVASHASAVYLRIAGDGPELPQIEELLARLDLADRAELVGVASDMPGFWASADVAVMPSTEHESFGMVALEAMASGRPVVATLNGGANDVVQDGISGALVPCGDVDALARAMLRYEANPALRRSHGAAGRARCESRYTMSRCAASYAQLLAELGGGPMPSPTVVETALEEVDA